MRVAIVSFGLQVAITVSFDIVGSWSSHRKSEFSLGILPHYRDQLRGPPQHEEAGGHNQALKYPSSERAIRLLDLQYTLILQYCTSRLEIPVIPWAFNDSDRNYERQPIYFTFHQLVLRVTQ